MNKKRYIILTTVLCILSMALLCFGLAACAEKVFKVTANYNEEQGTVTIAPEAADNMYTKGTEITVTVTPNEGYALDTFTLSTEDKAATPDNDGKFVFKVQEDTTITVTFKSTAIPVESVTLDEDTLELEVGGRTEDASATLVATVDPANATDKTVTWTSSNPAVATVDGGNVTALTVGETTITATAGGKSATCTVTVTQHNHNFSAWVDEVPATCVATGTKAHKQCTLCEKNFDSDGEEISELTIPVDSNAHHLVDGVGAEGHWQECDRDGCDYKSAVTGHTFNGALVDKGESGHTQKCSVEGCTFESAVTGHSAKDNEYEKDVDAGTHYQLCECGAHVNEATHAAKDNVWQHDEQNTMHFKLCVCGEHVEEDTHFASGYEYEQGGDMTTGKHYQVCEECKLQFNIGTHQQSAKPQNDTHGHHYSCTVCSFHGETQNHINPDPDGKWTNDVEASGGHQHYYICSACDGKVVEMGASLSMDYTQADGEYQYCAKCDYRERLRAHNLTYMSDGAGMHHAECQNTQVAIKCTYKTESESCKDTVDVDGNPTVTWTVAEDPSTGHTGKCACGNEIALEAHDTEGKGGACSKCGYLAGHTCSDSADADGYFDGVCDDCGKIVADTWTFASGTISAYNGNYAKVKIPTAIDSVPVTTFSGNFANNAIITDVLIPEGIALSEIDSGYTGLFCECSNLKTVIILAKITTLPMMTFDGCGNLDWIVLPDSITTVSDMAFYFGSRVQTTLNKVYFLGTQQQWEAIQPDSFSFVDSLEDIDVLKDATILYYKAEGGTSSANEWHWETDKMMPKAWD